MLIQDLAQPHFQTAHQSGLRSADRSQLLPLPAPHLQTTMLQFFKKTPMQDVTEEDMDDLVEAEEVQVELDFPEEVDIDGEWL